MEGTLSTIKKIDQDIQRDVKSSIRSAVNEHFPGIDENSISEMIALLAGPLAVLVDSVTRAKEINYPSVDRTAFELTADLIRMKGSDEGTDLSDTDLDAIINTFGVAVAQGIGSIVRRVRPEPQLSNLLRFVRFAKTINIQARRDPANICHSCGKPKSLPFVPAVGGSAEKTDEGEFIAGEMLSPQTMGLCVCGR
jgi:hypothetical protein